MAKEKETKPELPKERTRHASFFATKDEYLAWMDKVKAYNPVNFEIVKDELLEDLKQYD